MSPRDQAAVDAARAAWAAYVAAHRPSVLATTTSDAIDATVVALAEHARAGRPTSRVRCALELLTSALRRATREG